MLLPNVFGGNGIFDELMDNDWFGTRMNNASANLKRVMNTDIVEKDGHFEMTIELPGYKKEDIQASVKDGYLNISASRESEKNDDDEEGKVIRRERYFGSCKRTYYVGENVTDADIKASFENGELKLIIPKKVEEKVEPQGISIS